MIVTSNELQLEFTEYVKQYRLLFENFLLARKVYREHYPSTLLTLRLLMSQHTNSIVEDDAWLQRFMTYLSANDGVDIPPDFVRIDNELHSFIFVIDHFRWSK